MGKEAAAKLQKEKEVKEEAERAKKARDADQLRTLFQQIDLDGNGVLNFEEFQRAFQAAGGLGDISTAKEVLETAKVKKQAEDDEEATARAEREKVKDHFPERKRSQKEEEKVVIKPANLSSRGKRVQEEDITMEEEDMSYQEQGDKFVEDKDSKVQDVVRHLLQEVKITINLKTLKHHIDHIFMIRLGTMLKAGTLTFDKYVRIKNQDRRRIKELIGHTTAQEYNEGEDVFASLDKALKLSGVRTKSEDDTAIGEQVALLLKQTRVPVSQKDFIYHMNKIITIILGMMLHVGVLTFTKFNQMKITHRADMDEMLDSHYDSHSDVFGVLERAVERHGHAAPSQRRKSAENLNVKRVQDRERRRGSEDNIMRRKDEMLEGWEGGERPEDSSMQKLGRMLDKGSLSKDKLKRPGIDNVRDAVQPVGDGKTSSRGGSRRESYDTMIEPVALAELNAEAERQALDVKEQEEREAAEKAKKEKEAKEAKEAAEKAQKEKEAKEAAEKARKEKEAKEAAEKAKKEQEAKEAAEKAAKEAAEKARKEKEAKEAAEKAQKEKEAKEAAEKARKEQEAKEAAEQARKDKEAAAEKAKQDEEAARLRTLFEQIDLDGNGVLNLEEFQKAFKQAGGLGGLMASPAQAPEEKEDESSDSSKAKDKVRDEFAERKKKSTQEEKIKIKPADLSGKVKKAAIKRTGSKGSSRKSQIEEDPDMRTAKDKDRNEFAE